MRWATEMAEMSPARAGKALRIRVMAPLLVALAAWGCDSIGEIEQPVPLYGEEPVAYPLSLWDEGVEGETILRVRVTDTGVVDSVEVYVSSGHVGLDSAAIGGIRDVRFEPGRRNGKRVRMWATLPVVFSTRPEPQGMD
jgi:TonB family protein